MWFGDLVTMRWWDDLWLNESFAELLGALTVDEATGLPGSWPAFTIGRKAWGYAADQLPTTHPVATDVGDNQSALLNFDGISYAKGASVLRQLMAYVGRDAFFAGVRAYLDRHAFGNSTLADLLAALAESSGRELRDWADAWLRTTGVSTLRPSWDGDELSVVAGVADAAVARIGVGPVGPGRRGAAAARPDRARRRRRFDAGAAGRAAAGSGAAQRRRPRVRQGALRRAVGRDAGPAPAGRSTTT